MAGSAQNATVWEHSPSYEDAHNSKSENQHLVPLKIATDEDFKDYGRIVRDFEAEEVWIVPWPSTGRRPVLPGTGLSGVVNDPFLFVWENDICTGENTALKMAPFITGRLPGDVSRSNRTHVLTRELLYHPDGGQVFYPTDGAFVALLALPGDDVQVEDFVAFYCDGSFGVQIKPSIWHAAVYPVADTAKVLGKQGALCACVQVDTVEEFGKYLRVPLKPELAG